MTFSPQSRTGGFINFRQTTALGSCLKWGLFYMGGGNQNNYFNVFYGKDILKDTTRPGKTRVDHVTALKYFNIVFKKSSRL